MIENTCKVSIRQGDGINHMSFSNGNSRAKCCCLGGSGHVIHLISALFPRVLPLPIRRCRGCWLGGTDSCGSGVQTWEAAENCTFSSLARLGSHRLICTNLSLEAMSSLHIFFDSSLLLLYFFFASFSLLLLISALLPLLLFLQLMFLLRSLQLTRRMQCPCQGSLQARQQNVRHHLILSSHSLASSQSSNVTI